MDIEKLKTSLDRIVVTTEDWGSTTYLMSAEAKIPTRRAFMVVQCGVSESDFAEDWVRDTVGLFASKQWDADLRQEFETYANEEMPTHTGSEFFADEIYGIENEDEDKDYYLSKLVNRIKTYDVDADAEPVVEAICAELNELINRIKKRKQKMITTGLDNTKRYIAEARPIMGEWRTVHSTANVYDSHYGQQCWVDDEGDNYGQITLHTVGIEVRNVREITDAEAAAWENEVLEV